MRDCVWFQAAVVIADVEPAAMGDAVARLQGENLGAGAVLQAHNPIPQIST